MIFVLFLWRTVKPDIVLVYLKISLALYALILMYVRGKSITLLSAQQSTFPSSLPHPGQ